MFDKIKEKIKKWWGKFLVIIGIGAVTVLAAANFGGNGEISQTIIETIKNKPVNERSIIKSKEIAKINFSGEYLKDNLRIEIIGNVKQIKVNDNYGIELFARAWRDDKQLGFGKDGKVEIEHFRIYINGFGENGHLTYLVIPDELGDIIVEYDKFDIETGEKNGIYTKKYRFDPIENIRISLAHTIDIMGKEGTNIEKGKIGNTIDVFSPVAGTGTAPIDSHFQICFVDLTYPNLRVATPTCGGGTTANQGIASLKASSIINQFKGKNRAGWGFPTSSIGLGEIASATLSIYTSTLVASTGLDDIDVDIVSFTPTDEANHSNSDGVITNFGTTRFATGIPVSELISSEAYKNFTLNQSGEDYINTSGNTFFGVLLKWDFDNNFTGTWVDSAQTYWRAYFVDEADSNKHPKLTVEYTEAPAVEEEEIKPIPLGLF